MKIIKQKNISEQCTEGLLWLYKTLEKENGLLKIKTENFATDVDFQYQLNEYFYKDYGNCLFKNLTKEEVVKMYGDPHRISNNARNAVESFEYFIVALNCSDMAVIQNGVEACGLLRFKFDQEDQPIGGILDLTNMQ